jgi:hypothetical protein
MTLRRPTSFVFNPKGVAASLMGVLAIKAVNPKHKFSTAGLLPPSPSQLKVPV